MTALSDLARPLRADDSGLAALLAWEGALRRLGSVAELHHHLANETRRLLAYDQMFVLARAATGGGWRVRAASSLPAVDRDAPLVRAIEAAVRGCVAACDLDAPDDDALADYPFRHWLWRPLLDRDGEAFGALLAARAHPFSAGEAARLERVAETAAHGWLALTGGRPVRRLPPLTRRRRRIAAGIAAAVALFPVHLSALAPVEVVPARPFAVTAPFAGVVAAIDVAPSARVRRGQTLLRFDDVKLRNELSLAAERLRVAEAKVRQVATASFADAGASHGMAVVEAEYRLAQAEHDYARDMLARARVVAPRNGVAIYTDRREWEGRAVGVGQPIMEVADPDRVRYRVDLPAAEQLSLEAGSAVSVWLDSSPLWSRTATLADASYKARPTPEGTLAFALTADPADGAAPRIGSRGTARVRGRRAPLAYALFRRPIAGARQWLGV